MSQEVRGIVPLTFNDETLSTTDNVGGETNQQIYINSYPQYDPDMSYHGYDLSRDVSEYKFDAANHLDQSSLSVNLVR